ncbi:MAG TPA: transposase [Isosphaeraceae bacterium]
MPNYRRYLVPGGLVFFTVVAYQPRPILTTALARRRLRAAIVTVRAKRPFSIPASVLLPDHLHMIWELPRGDAAYSVRWRRIKEEFTRHFLDGGGPELPRSVSRRRRQERAVWQRRFWEHTIEDEEDFARHVDYIHYNPVKHGLVRCPRDWPYSSFQRYPKRGVYDPDWGCATHGPHRFDDLDETAME